jgi:hypothetical protein
MPRPAVAGRKDESNDHWGENPKRKSEERTMIQRSQITQTPRDLTPFQPHTTTAKNYFSLFSTT